jgi:hypothetical protein
MKLENNLKTGPVCVNNSNEAQVRDSDTNRAAGSGKTPASAFFAKAYNSERAGSFQISVIRILVAISVLSCTLPGTAAELSLRFPATPKICGVADFPNVATFPDDKGQDPTTARDTPRVMTQRQYVQDLFSDVYPEIVKIYGPPNTATSTLEISLYHATDVSNHMYIAGSVPQAKVVLKTVFASLLAGTAVDAASIVDAITPPCLALTDIPVHSIFIADVPSLAASADNRKFDHAFTHELIHAFHDRLDLVGWHAHLWIEEGMTEAATELVAVSLQRQGKRNLVVNGLDRSSLNLNYAHGEHPGRSPRSVEVTQVE